MNFEFDLRILVGKMGVLGFLAAIIAELNENIYQLRQDIDILTNPNFLDKRTINEVLIQRAANEDHDEDELEKLGVKEAIQCAVFIILLLLIIMYTNRIKQKAGGFE